MIQFKMAVIIKCNHCRREGNGFAAVVPDLMAYGEPSEGGIQVVATPDGWKVHEGGPYDNDRVIACAVCAPSVEQSRLLRDLELVRNYVEGHPPRLTYDPADGGWWLVEGVRCKKSGPRPVFPDPANECAIEDYQALNREYMAWVDSRPSDAEARAFALANGWTPA